MEALDDHNNWVEIENNDQAGCSTGFYLEKIPPNGKAMYVGPLYTGNIKTKLRLKAFLQTGDRFSNAKIIYSNEFEGSINPAQLWRNEYWPDGIHD